MSTDYLKDTFLRFLSNEFRLVNKHLPYERKSLCELLDMNIPYLVLRDGSIHLINIEELLLLKKIMGSEACNLMIPLIIEAAPSLGEATYIVRDPPSKKALSRLLGMKYDKEKPLIIYRPQLYMIRSRLPTTTIIIFVPT